jgi:maltose-binding protein MalE
MKRTRPTALLLVVVSALVGMTLMVWRPWEPRLEVGGVRINPKAEIRTDKSYNVVVWDYELPLPGSRLTHREALHQAAQDFSREYPNIAVEVVVRHWDEGDGPIRDALEHGYPPDVLGMPHGIRLLTRDYQVPLQHYVEKEQSRDIFKSAENAATLSGHLWAFPRWINPSRWVIRLDRWPDNVQGTPDEKETIPSSLTLSQWTEALAESRTKSGGDGLAVNVLDPSFFYDLMVSATGQPLLGPEGQLQWSEESILAVAEQLQSWATRGFLPSSKAEAVARIRLGLFWDGKALALAPVNPWLLNHVLQRSGAFTLPPGDVADPAATGVQVGRLEKVQRIVTWTPPPKMGPELRVPATVAGYAVFRQASYKGDDHTRAAATVAEYMSRRMGQWEAVRIFAVPAHPSSIDGWLTTSRLPENDMRALIDWSAAAVTSPVNDGVARLMSRILVETAVPNLVLLLKGEMSPNRFAQELAATPLTAAAEVGVP